MAQIILIEDELLIAESTAALIRELGHEVIAIAGTENEALDIFSSLNFDLAFVDINLNSNNEGIHLGKLLSELGKPYIYLTSYSDKETLELAKSTKPSAYIVKPADRVDIYTNLEIVLAREVKTPKARKKITLKDGRIDIKVDTNEILWIRSEHVYLEIQLKERKLIQRMSLSKMMNLLKGSAIHRCHRSWAVNMDYVKKMGKDFLFIKRHKIPVSDSYQNKIHHTFNTQIE